MRTLNAWLTSDVEVDKRCERQCAVKTVLWLCTVLLCMRSWTILCNASVQDTIPKHSCERESCRAQASVESRHPLGIHPKAVYSQISRMAAAKPFAALLLLAMLVGKCSCRSQTSRNYTSSCLGLCCCWVGPRQQHSTACTCMGWSAGSASGQLFLHKEKVRLFWFPSFNVHFETFVIYS